MQQFLKIPLLDVETFWGNIFETFICLSETKASNGTFYKRNSKSMRDRFVCTIQLAMNILNKHFHNLKNRKISGIAGEEDIYNIAWKEYEEVEGKPFPFYRAQNPFIKCYGSIL